MPTPNKYPQEFREKAVRMAAEIGGPGAMRRVSEALGVNRETVRYWVKNTPVSKGGKRGLTDEEIAELMRYLNQLLFFSPRSSTVPGRDDQLRGYTPRSTRG